MAVPRKLWSALKPATQKRKLGFYRKRGLSDAAIKSRYNAGTLGPQSAARGHADTPERPEIARRNPGRYRKYIEKRRPKRGGGDYIFTRRDLAYSNVYSKLRDYARYGDAAVRKRVYSMMSDKEVEWTINASEDMLVGRAAANYGMRLFGTYTQSPWWYHKD